MKTNKFDWNKLSQLSVIQFLLATFIPSAFAFMGFHFIAPRLVTNGIPALYAWLIVASTMLLILIIIAIILLLREARKLEVPLSTRVCFRKLSIKELLIYILLFIISAVICLGASKLVVPMINMVGFKIPSYTPFFLNPEINTATSDLATLAPGVQIIGNYGLVVFVAITILLNVLAEEFYFRAWMLPKLSKYGAGAWVINGFLFAFYHTFQLWLLPVLLIGSLIMAFIFYKSKSIWPTLIGHLVTNFLFSLLGILLLVMGSIPNT